METRSRLVLFLSSALVFIALAGFFASPFTAGPAASAVKSAKPESSGKPFTAPKQNVWAELSEHEASQVFDHLLEEMSHLNLTTHPKTGHENFVYQVETLRPNKTDALPYVYSSAAVPERWAKVVINENRDGRSFLVYYAVGPLPRSHNTQIMPLEYPFNSGKNYVANLMSDFVSSLDFALAIGENASDITQELLGAKANRSNPDDPNGLVSIPRPTKLEEGGVMLWLQFFRPGAGSNARTILPQGLYVKVNATNPNVDEWTVGDFFYNGVLYKDADELRAAMKSPEFQKTPANLDGSWTDTEDFDAQPDGRELPPPISIQPYGPRYRMDKKEQFVSWFGFEFYITTAVAQGITLYDIRFKGERVMYELGLQEAMAHYAGEDPMSGGQEFLDSFFGMGSSAFELVPGYDCPAYADYLNAEYHRSYKTDSIPNSICVFEYTSDYLLSRHTAQYSVTASRNTFLTVRSVATVGNYDYTIDYQFYLDGSIEVKVRASGYIFGAFYMTNPDKSEDEYGHRVHTALTTSMHDHVINFKADMDVAGTKNDLVRLALEPHTKQYAWDDVKSRNTMHLKEYTVNQETGLDWPKNSGELYIVYSADAKNAWGERKGYRITSGTGMGNTPHLTIVNSTNLGNSARWAEHDIWVVQQKDNEPRSADPLNYLEPLNPLIDFTKVANGESLEHGAPDTDYDGDLVIYFNVGSHHIPHSGDIPNTLMHTSATSVMFVPHNFADRDPSRESVQGVRLQLKGTTAGGFPGWDEAEVDDSIDNVNEDLRARMTKHAKKAHKMHKGANYFGTPYTKGMKLALEAVEPDLEEDYKSSQIPVSNLDLNGSAAGAWWDDMTW